jgi:hypothetical protein
VPPIWTTNDCRGQVVEFWDWAYGHAIEDHPEILGLQDILKAAVERPTLCVRQKDDSVHYYALGVIPARPNLYLHVVARDDAVGGPTLVKTAWQCKAVDRFEDFLCTPTKS